MLSETFLFNILALVFGFSAIIYGIRAFYTKVLSDKYIKESRKLQLLINNLKKEYKELGDEPLDFIGGALGELGIDGIMEQFGVNPAILKNPIVRGFIDKYAPTIMEKLEKGELNVKEPVKKTEIVTQV